MVKLAGKHIKHKRLSIHKCLSGCFCFAIAIFERACHGFFKIVFLNENIRYVESILNLDGGTILREHFFMGMGNFD